MKEKITKLARGTDNIEVPSLRLSPQAMEQEIAEGGADTFVLGVTSINGVIVKGVITSDEPRVAPQPAVFAGRMNYISVCVNAAGLPAGAVIEGSLSLITEAGESAIPYHFFVLAGESELPRDSLIIDDPLRFEPEDREKAGRTRKFPDDPQVFSELISGLIGAGDHSPFAYAAFREAIRRGLDIAGLYESFMLSYPYGSADEIPREVALYFYFDPEMPAAVAERLFAALLMKEEEGSELLLSFAPRMSAFAKANAMEQRIGARLRLIYDRMISADMLDASLAALLPDILCAVRISLSPGEASELQVTYPGLNLSVRAPVRNGLCFVPIYFRGDELHFFDAQGREIEHVKYRRESLFDRPDLLLRCFELCPGHRMLVLSAVREITRRGGTTSERDKEILLRGLQDEACGRELRRDIIMSLASSGGDLDWIRYLTDSDYSGSVPGELFRAFMRAGDIESAYSIIRRFGIESIDVESLSALCDRLLERRPDKLSSDPDFIRIAAGLTDSAQPSPRLIEFLCAHYIGSVDKMLKLMDIALQKHLDISELPENILSFMLFSGVTDRIDDVFRAYAASPVHDETLVDAYLVLRSGDWFLYGDRVDEPLLFSALYGRLRDASDPACLPVILLIAWSAHCAKSEGLSEDETALLRTISDYLIDEGLIFRYTKELRRFIPIPDEVRWRYYIEYHLPRGAGFTPHLKVRVLPDESEYHEEEMKRVYAGVYISRLVLFTGDRLEYAVFPSAASDEVLSQGTISVVREKKESNERMKGLNRIIKALRDSDSLTARESMLAYVLEAETKRILFDPGDQ